MANASDLGDLLKHFDAETAKRLQAMLSAGEITPGQVQDIIRVTAAVPEYRDPDEFDSLLEDAEEMDEEGFKSWVGKIIEDKKDT